MSNLPKKDLILIVDDTNTNLEIISKIMEWECQMMFSRKYLNIYLQLNL